MEHTAVIITLLKMHIGCKLKNTGRTNVVRNIDKKSKYAQNIGHALAGDATYSYCVPEETLPIVTGFLRGRYL